MKKLVVVMLAILLLGGPARSAQGSSDAIERAPDQIGVLYHDTPDSLSGKRPVPETDFYLFGRGQAPSLLSQAEVERLLEERGGYFGLLAPSKSLKQGREEVSGLEFFQTPPVYRAANILCRFPEDFASPDVKDHLRDIFAPDSLLNKFWEENSYGKFRIEAETFGWFQLPRAFDDYYARQADGSVSFQWWQLMQECLLAPGLRIDFSRFDGFNLIFSGNDFGAAGGRIFWPLGEDKLPREFGVTLLPRWALGLSTLVHELGHALGLPHQTDPYGRTYRSPWSPMSNSDYLPPDLPREQFVSDEFGIIPQHFSVLEKTVLGWVPGSRVVSALPSQQTVTILEQSALPQGGEGLLLIFRTPVMGKEQFFALEVRQRLGSFDGKLPPVASRGPVGILYRVNEFSSEPFMILDADQNGDLADEGVALRAGETFPDLGLYLCVSGQVRSAGQTRPSRLFIRTGPELGADCPLVEKELFLPLLLMK